MYRKVKSWQEAIAITYGAIPVTWSNTGSTQTDLLFAALEAEHAIVIHLDR